MDVSDYVVLFVLDVIATVVEYLLTLQLVDRSNLQF